MTSIVENNFLGMISSQVLDREFNDYYVIQMAAAQQRVENKKRRARLRALRCVSSGCQAALAASGSVAAESNPLKISHSARTISCRASGAIKIPRSGPNRANKGAARYNTAPTRPQTDNQ